MLFVENLTRQQFVLLGALAGLITFLVSGSIGFFCTNWPTAKLLRTASSLAALSSALQLQSSGWFAKVVETYSSEKEFPFGPPSAITRQIIDNPDYATLSLIRNTLLFDPGTGAKLAITSIIIGIFATWA